ncbi:MAG: hypothetical protein INR69_20600, partial [Mucilaginibacter polytrichastri]|nr:hypothetical protein [Mucilaginibacter polytrichastri]
MPAPVSTFVPARTIDEVIIRLEAIITESIRKNSCGGYFAVLYHRVTSRVKEGIGKKEFEDGPRMEKLDVIFANRYLEAWHCYQSGNRCSGCWKTAFDSAIGTDRIIMQHLLLGINAHINLDLGIAAAETMHGFPVDGIRKDFDAINAVLASLVDEVQTKMTKASPLLFLLNLHKASWDEMLVQFSINTARQGAWDFAVELSGKKDAPYQDCVSLRDGIIARLASGIANP